MMPSGLPDFDRRAAQYDSHAALQREAAAWLAEWLPEQIAAPALELGAGTGLFTRHLAARTRGLVACDVAPGMVQIGRSSLPEVAWSVAEACAELDRLVVRALVAGRVLQVNVRPGEFVGTPPNQPLVILGNIDRLHVRVDIDEYDIARFRSQAAATAFPRGNLQERYPLEFVRVEPFVVPKKSLTGDTTERVDTRVLQVIYEFDPAGRLPLFVGQQVEVYIDVAAAPVAGG